MLCVCPHFFHLPLFSYCCLDILVCDYVLYFVCAVGISIARSNVAAPALTIPLFAGWLFFILFLSLGKHETMILLHVLYP
jgi:hypothetical protein